MGKGKTTHENIVIDYVCLVENLYYNLFSISQLCANGCLVEFYKSNFLTKDVEN